ncbi:hypothetical protein CC2G_006180 [Coprinopsis cinerea AmutBmut pab1-1]|nr:hypothetical protein CC2G_006180 [Coprinopsis cinerea AmutBmut pab1-1]
MGGRMDGGGGGGGEGGGDEVSEDEEPEEEPGDEEPLDEEPERVRENPGECQGGLLSGPSNGGGIKPTSSDLGKGLEKCKISGN